MHLTINYRLFHKLNAGLLLFIVYFLLSLKIEIQAQEANKENSTSNDWPMFRHDAQRSASTPAKLPEKLKLIWTRSFPALSPIWLDETSKQFDSNYHPIVIGSTLYLASPQNDCLYAISTKTGEILWKFYADGPIRFAPAGQGDKIYFVSDDSHLYCIKATNGDLLWKFKGAPNDSKILANGRLSSTWPARGGPAIYENNVFFSAGIWPFMGSFVYAINAETGKLVWKNTGSGSLFGNQAHSSPAFAGVSPQGYITATKNILLIPNGKASPSGYNINTGELLYSNFTQGGSFFASATDNLYFSGAASFFVANNKFAGKLPAPQILTADFLYAGGLQAFDLKNILPQEEKKPGDKSDPILPLSKLWSLTLKINPQIFAGNRLYATNDKSIIFAYDLPEFNKEIKDPKLAWQLDVKGTIGELIAADNKLFAVTLEGNLLCFGDENLTAQTAELKETVQPLEKSTYEDTILTTTNQKEGYAIVLGVGTGKLIEHLISTSDLTLIVVESDASLVHKFRKKWDGAKIYGSRLTIIQGNPLETSFPPYIANLIVSENLDFSKENFSLVVPRVFNALRPYGGTACFMIPANLKDKWSQAINDVKLQNASYKNINGLTLLIREGPLTGAGVWNHQYGDSANTGISNDTIVKLPLGILWFGGPSNKNNLPKHGHGPNPHVIGGRVITQGLNTLQAYDAYTGRLFWEIELPNLGKDYNNLAHQPGASAIGGNYISLSDFVYVVFEGKCLKLDARTGKKVETFALPPLEGQSTPANWSFIAISGDFLIAGAEKISDKKVNPGDFTWNGTTSKGVVVLNRLTGKVIWKKEAEYGFRHNTIAISKDTLFCIDMIPKEAQLVWTPNKVDGLGKIYAFDLQTGNLNWSTDQGVFGTWMSYSIEHDVLLQAGRASRDMLKDEINNRMSALQGKTGKLLWDKPNSYSGPCLLLDKDILAQGNGFNLLDGTPKLIKDAITNRDIPWGYSRFYGCNTAIGSKNLLTFRSAAAGFFNLEDNCGTGNFGGFKTSCTSTMIVADGLLNIPDYTRGCTCSYHNRATLALIHQPETESWTFNANKWKGQVQRLGINLGAPGDRISSSKTMWVEYPSIGGPSQDIPIKTSPKDINWFSQHSLFMQGSELTWVGASGAKGIDSIKIPTGNSAKTESLYTIRLVFSEPDDIKPKERLMDISIQGKTVLEGLDVCQEASGTNKVLIKEFKNIKLSNELSIELKANANATKKETLLCGVELIAE